MKARTRKQRLFLRWLKTERARFNHPLRVNRITKDMVYFNFQGISPFINGTFGYGKGRSGIDVWIMWEKYHTDLLFDVSLFSWRDKHGYFCNACLPESKEFFSSRNELLRNHLLEVFLNWVNENLSESSWIDMSGVEDKWTEAVLKRKNGEFHSTTTYSQKGCICKLIPVKIQL